jgi:hypothetical protein
MRLAKHHLISRATIPSPASNLVHLAVADASRDALAKPSNWRLRKPRLVDREIHPHRHHQLRRLRRQGDGALFDRARLRLLDLQRPARRQGVRLTARPGSPPLARASGPGPSPFSHRPYRTRCCCARAAPFPRPLGGARHRFQLPCQSAGQLTCPARLVFPLEVSPNDQAAGVISMSWRSLTRL